MESVRRLHNGAKRDLINRYTPPGSHVLDMGCGRGGDLRKWQPLTDRICMGDPCTESVKDARQRAEGLDMKPRFFHGVIKDSPQEKFDVICFNFSLQYVFVSRSEFIHTMVQIKNRSKRGTRVIGCIPDSDFIIMNPKLQDKFGNIFIRNKINTGEGKFGEKIQVCLAETPYYNGNFISEPIAYKDTFITWMERSGFVLQEWSPLLSEETGTISDLYSKFCFLAV